MSDDFETQWEMAARTKRWKCPSCGTVQTKTEAMKRLTVARERDSHLLVTDGSATCPKCNQPIDLAALADGEYDIQSKREKKENAQGYGCLFGGLGAIIAFVVVYQFYDWPFPLIAAAAAFAVLFGLAYYKFKPE